jgi:hypothetical protein
MRCVALPAVDANDGHLQIQRVKRSVDFRDPPFHQLVDHTKNEILHECCSSKRESGEGEIYHMLICLFFCSFFVDIMRACSGAGYLDFLFSVSTRVPRSFHQPFQHRLAPPQRHKLTHVKANFETSTSLHRI